MSVASCSRLVGLLFAAALALPVGAATDTVPETYDLSTRGPLAARPDLPLLLVFVADDCFYCERLAEEVLVPMLRSGDYDERVVIRAVNLTGRKLVGFDGASVDPWDFAGRYDVKVTPTMVLVDHEGTLLADPLVGLGPVEYVETRIVAALKHASHGRSADDKSDPVAHGGEGR